MSHKNVPALRSGGGRTGGEGGFIYTKRPAEKKVKLQNAKKIAPRSLEALNGWEFVASGNRKGVREAIEPSDNEPNCILRLQQNNQGM